MQKQKMLGFRERFRSNPVRFHAKKSSGNTGLDYRSILSRVVCSATRPSLDEKSASVDLFDIIGINCMGDTFPYLMHDISDVQQKKRRSNTTSLGYYS